MRESNKKHLLATVRLLGLDPPVIERMERSGEDEAHHGGTVDSRATLDDVVATIDSVLTPAAGSQTDQVSTRPESARLFRRQLSTGLADS